MALRGCLGGIELLGNLDRAGEPAEASLAAMMSAGALGWLPFSADREPAMFQAHFELVRWNSRNLGAKHELSLLIREDVDRGKDTAR